MTRINRKTLHVKVTLAKRLNHYIGWGLERAIQEAEGRGASLDGTAIELALMNRAGHNLEALAAAMGKAQEKSIRAEAKKIETTLRAGLKEKHSEVDRLSTAIACIALAKKAIISLDKQITSR